MKEGFGFCLSERDCMAGSECRVNKNAHYILPAFYTYYISSLEIQNEYGRYVNSHLSYVISGNNFVP